MSCRLTCYPSKVVSARVLAQVFRSDVMLPCCNSQGTFSEPVAAETVTAEIVTAHNNENRDGKNRNSRNREGANRDGWNRDGGNRNGLWAYGLMFGPICQDYRCSKLRSATIVAIVASEKRPRTRLEDGRHVSSFPIIKGWLVDGFGNLKIRCKFSAGALCQAYFVEYDNAEPYYV